ncbi:hypothetical protein [Candidatus Phyllobacterium onerii]|uniref:hypothetical protein n=1 Tax=Candidatus Phyllobacterium onerii TaxID=3020828 RepID=UPI00232D5F63|nr:hypothetical protein [Phyllobacterium sp. IY22]
MVNFSKIIMAGVGFVFVALLAIVYVIGEWSVTDSVALPALAITGVVVLLASLAMVAVTFSYMGMGDNTQALALPEGSIRAVIALCLIVLFAILSIYLFGKLSSPIPIQTISGLSLTERASLVERLQPSEVVGLPDPIDNKYSVYVRQSVRAESIDFAQQLLIMLGTLVVSISSFYFGSKATESYDRTVPRGTDISNSQPVITSVSPSTLKRAGTAKTMLILGENLENVQTVVLSSGNASIRGTGVTATVNAVTCDMSLNSDVPEGAWTLSLTDSSGKAINAPQSITVTANAQEPAN